jgi:hypothetical protein
MTEDRPAASGAPPSSEETPSWPRRAARAAADAAWEDLSDTGRRWVDRGRGYTHGAWSRRPSRGTLVARTFVMAVGLAGALSLLAQTRLADRLPTDLDWRAAAELLERDSRPGDVAVVSPAWAERARAELPARLPVFSLRRYAQEPLLGVNRIWLVTLSDAPGASDRIGLDIAARADVMGGAQRVGALTVTRYDLAQPARPLAFLPDRLASATAKAGEHGCEPAGPLELRCATEPPERIAREEREAGGIPRPCITVTPGAARTGPVAITFPAVPMGASLRGGAGTVGRLPAPAAAPIHFALQVDGREIAAMDLPSAAAAWSRFDVSTGALSGQPHAVTVVLTSPDPAGRTVCFDAWTLP